MLNLSYNSINSADTVFQPSQVIFICFDVQPMQYIPTITNYTQLWWVPNVVVAHEKEGIEAVHLATGRTLCKVKNTDGRLALCFVCHILPVN